MNIIGIDIGTIKSGIAYYDTNAKMAFGEIVDNKHIFECIQMRNAYFVALERFECYGMPVGESSFESVRWEGRLMQWYESMFPDRSLYHISRKDVKLCLCGSTRAKDANVRQAIMDRFPKTGGGKNPVVGIKKQKGPLYSIKSHAWAALGVAITCEGIIRRHLV